MRVLARSVRRRALRQVPPALLVALMSLALLPAPASAWCQMTSSDARPTTSEPCVLVSLHPGSHELAWRRRCTSISFSAALGVAATEGRINEDMARVVLGRSISTWTSVDCGGAVSGLEVTILPEANACTRAAHYRGGRNVHTIVFVADGWATERLHDPRALAVTYVWHDPATGEILDADMELNEDTKDFHVCALEACADVVPLDSAVVDLENTVTHELGHYFGIAHTPDDREATMFSEAAAGETLKRDLRDDDRAALCGIYVDPPAMPLPATCDPTPAGGLGLDCAPASSCGCSAVGARASSAGAALLLGLGLVVAGASRRRQRAC